ncbi:hydroxyacid dehydrogenase [Peptoniphilus phoceensis]|uniref:hydroxyacid dehydrogenase n=1 Tax=Peptoniphilus phoceensis TaxID=1720298 RepID=UPI0007830EA5|nr:hydroxyacid dehydrogenase [Peptoniphilus phoceensis]
MKILITEKINQKGLEMIEQSGFTVINAYGNEEIINKNISEVEGIVVRTFPLNSNLLKKAKKLKIISKHGVGIDNIDTEYCSNNGIVITKTPGANSLSVAEHAFSMMISLSKNLKHISKEYVANGFEAKNNIIGFEMSNKTLGIIGLGSIGQNLLKLTKGFNMKVLAFDPYLKNKVDGVKIVEEIEELIVSSDFISIHCALTDSTRNLINYEKLKKMKKNAILVNCARGGIINENDLIKAINENLIYGAGLDVTEKEPLEKDDELFNHDNIIITPHSAVSTKEASENVAIIAATNIINYFKEE